MRLNHWLKSFFAVPPRRRTRTAAAAVEALEDRTLLTTFTVNTTADTVDADPGDGVAEDSNGETSLRAAVMEADGLAGQEVDIVLPGGTYVLGGALHFNAGANVSLVGESAATSIIDGGHVDRVLYVHGRADVFLANVTVKNGLSDSGGGIANNGTLTISATQISSNKATVSGGGIANRGVLTLKESTVSGNIGLRYGTGILSDTSRSVVHILNSTVSGNYKEEVGWNPDGVQSFDGTLDIVNSTVAQNSHGGVGIGNKVAFFLANSIVASNGGGDDYDCVGCDHPIVSGGGNLIGTAHVDFATGAAGDLIGTPGNAIDPMLGLLQDNGGPTPTHALLPGSPAIDAGRDPNSTTTDQRGIARPQDGNGDGTAAVDIGAYEWIENAPPTLDEIAAPEPITESSGQQTISLAGITGGIGESQAVQVTATSSNQAVILDPVVSYTSPEFTGTLTYTPAGLGISEVTVTVTDGGTDDDFGTTPDNATVTRTFTVDVRDSGILYVDADDWSDDGLTVLLDGANVRVVVTGTDTDAVSPTALAGITAIDVSGRPDADDLLTVDYTGGNPAPSGGITFDGDTGSDALALENGSVTTTGYVFTDASSGTIDVDGGVITYTNLEPITDNLSAVDRVFTFGPGSDEVTLVDIAGISRLSSVSSSETVDFTAPTGSLTINTSAGNDTVDTSGSNLAVTLNGGAGFDWLTGGPSADRLLGGGRNDTLDGGAGADTISGQAGFDWLYGGDDGDSLDGGDGDDTIDGEAGDDTILGGEGFDRLLGGSGNDQIDGGTEDDRIGGGDGDDTLDGGDGNDFLNGQSGDDDVDGGLGEDRVFGGAGNDVVYGGDGSDSDRMNGNSGDDVFIAGLSEKFGSPFSLYSGDPIADRIYDSNGTDTLSASIMPGEERLVVFTSNDTSNWFARVTIINDRFNASYTLFQGIEHVSLVGDDTNNILTARLFDGTTEINGRGGDDVIDGGTNTDLLNGGDGNDTLNGRGGDDVINGDSGDDRLMGGGSDDTLNGGAGADTILGHAGFDRLHGGDDGDSLNGGDGDDTILGVAGDDYIRGGVGADYLSGGGGNDTINGGDGNDTIKGGTGNDGLSGADGKDWLYGSSGNDTLIGRAGNDRLYGNAGDDIALGGDGDDRINCSTGTDTVAGNAGTDVIKDDFSEIDEAFTFEAPWVDDD